MPSRLERVNAAHSALVRRKQFSEPPLWSLDRLSQQPWWPISSPDKERIEHSFEGYAAGAGRGNSVVFACMYARLRVFAGATFLWQEFGEQPGSLFWTPELQLLRRPWPNGTTADLLAWMEVDASLAGNCFLTTADDRGRFGAAATGPGRRVVRMRPDWVTLVIGSRSDDPYALDAHVVAYVYEPPTSVTNVEVDPVVLLPSEVCHYAPIPDPLSRFRGMAWLTPVLREVGVDIAAQKHKQKFFEHGAALQTMVALDKDISPEAFEAYVKKFRSLHEGADNAYKTLFTGGGADVTVVGTDLQKLDFRAVQGGLETRIAAAAGVHPVVVGLSEGLQGSSLNAGNYSAARRNVADGTLHHLWSNAAASLEDLLTLPSQDTRLWYDHRHIPFLREDAKDVAQIQQIRANALRSLVDGGWDPDAAAEYLRSDDLGQLVGNHSGFLSVQLQPLGQRPDPEGGTDA